MVYSDDAEDMFLRLDLVDDSVVADPAGTASCKRTLERFPAEGVSRSGSFLWTPYDFLKRAAASPA